VTKPLLLLVAPAWGEKHVQSTLHSRIVPGFKGIDRLRNYRFSNDVA